MNGKIVQMTLWESDQLIVPMRQGNACRGKGLAGKPLGQGNILRTLRRCKDSNRTIPMTYTTKCREVLLKSRMRENLKSGSVRGLIVTPELLLQKGVAMSSTRHSLCTIKNIKDKAHMGSKKPGRDRGTKMDDEL